MLNASKVYSADFYTECKGYELLLELMIIIYVIRNQNVLTTFFSYFNCLTNYLSLKLRRNGNIERQGALIWTERASTFCLRSQRDPFAFFIALARLSDQKINDISSMTWTKQNKKHFFSEKTIKVRPHMYIYIYIYNVLVLSTVSDDC